MKKLSKKIIQSLMVSAAFSLLGTNAQAKDVSAADLTESADGNIDEQHDILKTNIFHNVLKISSSGKLYGVDSHRSHSSHRSHRSSRYNNHSSHYSSTYSSGSSGSSTQTPKTTPAQNSASNFVSTATPAYETYSLGDRTLSQGSYGSDVDELVSKLKKYYYLKSDFSAKKAGYALYDATVVAAVKDFQQDAGLSVSGTFGSKDKSALNHWDASKTKIKLGIRSLTVGDSGNDVYELVKLLEKAGCPPNPKLLEDKGRKYTTDVAMAVKVFQAFAGLSVTGIADIDTINKLKSSAK